MIVALIVIVALAVWWLRRRARRSPPAAPPRRAGGSLTAEQIAADVRAMSEQFQGLLGELLGVRASGGSASRTGPGGRALVMDAECVDDAADYVPVVARISALASPWLAFEQVTCVERGEVRQLDVAQAGRWWRAELRGQTDWLDTGGLLPFLNEVLADLGASGRLHEVETGYEDQSVGIVFVEPEEASQLQRAGALLEPFEAAPSAELAYPVAPGTTVHYHPNARPARLRLAEDTEIQGIPCAGSTDVVLDRNGILSRGVLARPHRFGGLWVPAGACVMFWEEHVVPYEIELPQGDQVHGLSLPPGSALGFDEASQLIYANLGQAMLVGGELREAGTFVSYREGAWTVDS